MEKLKNYLSVAFFAFFGGLGRYYLGVLWQSTGTIVANLLGCFLLSFLTYYVIELNILSGWLNVGLGTGFIGAFTTFFLYGRFYEVDSCTFNDTRSSLLNN